MENKAVEQAAPSQARIFWETLTQATVGAPETVDPDSKALIHMVIQLAENATVVDIFDNKHNALEYAMHLYCAADKVIGDKAYTNDLIRVALLLAMQESDLYCSATWSYGAKLLFETKKAGIRLTRSQIAAFLAQEGSWSTNRSKSDLMTGNQVAVAIYCAKLRSVCQTLVGHPGDCGGTEEALEKIEETQSFQTLEDVFSFYLKEFAIPYLQGCGAANAEAEVDAFLAWLRKSDFYHAPCSTKYHLNREGGLAEHTYNVLMQMLWLTLPATKKQLGACVLAAIGHDLCKVGIYKKQYKSKKIYITEGMEVPTAAFVKEDAGGRFYWGDDYYYEFNDTMPFGHGRKSAYMLQGFFPEIGMDVYAAVDAHMADAATNPHYMWTYGEQPMALNLHLADMLATYIVEL